MVVEGMREGMSFNPNSAEPLAALREHLRRCRMNAVPAVGDLIAATYALVGSQRPAAKARVAHLVESGAFTDATLALLELEFPRWKLRRLIYDADEWHCALSQRPPMPFAFEDMAEESHPILTLAIVCALLGSLSYGCGFS